jgi:cAMP phosphodiesterase
LLIDAGSVASGIQIAEQVLIDNILISHSHLDHISDLAFMADNCFGQKGCPFEIYTNPQVRKSIMDHLLNDAIWPDFTALPNKENPTLRFHDLTPEEEIEIGGYKVRSVPVNHPGGAQGFIIKKNKKAIVFTQDTGPTDLIWEYAKKEKDLKGIFTEVSFPIGMEKLALDSQHHTPLTLKAEMKKMPPEVPIFLGHLKPNFQDQLFKEIDAMGCERITVLGSDDTSYMF